MQGLKKTHLNSVHEKNNDQGFLNLVHTSIIYLEDMQKCREVVYSIHTCLMYSTILQCFNLMDKNITLNWNNVKVTQSAMDR